MLVTAGAVLCALSASASAHCSTKTNVSPAPVGGVDNTGPAGRFLCYKLKCPKATLAQLQWHDQFGNRLVTPSVPKILCAPEITSTSTTTTTSNNPRPPLERNPF